MGRTLTLVVLSIAVQGCDLRLTQLGSLGQGGAGGGGVPLAQSPACAKYVGCYEATGGVKNSLDPSYGPQGSCWSSGQAASVACGEACAVGLDELRLQHPNEAACGGTPGVDAGCPIALKLKVVVLLDQSGSMCVTDPPGSQGGAAGFCQSIIPPAGVTEPARVRALKALMTRLGTRGARVSLIPFAGAPQGIHPASGFTSPSDAALLTAIAGLQGQLGKATDMQSALDAALQVVTEDIAALKTTPAGTSELAQTHYGVLLISDGTPFPRCSADDALPTYADSTMPGGIWPDSPGAGSYCNDPDGGSNGDRNQNAALFARVTQLVGLKSQGAAQVRFNAQLLFNAQRITECGPICQDLYGTYAEVPAAQQPQAALTVARYTLQQLASKGSGSYAEALDDFGISTLPSTLPNTSFDPVCP